MPLRLVELVHSAWRFSIVLGIALLAAVQLGVMDMDPIKALCYSQLLDGLIAPLLVVLLLLLTSSRKVMGDFVNRLPTRIIGWLAVAVLIAADIAMVNSIITSGFPG